MSDRTTLDQDLRLKLALAKRIVKPVVKTEEADLDKYTYTYANIGAVMKAVDEACAEAEIGWVQYTTYHGDGDWSLDTEIIDLTTGHSITYGGALSKVKGDPQATGGVLTYYRRYGLVTLFGLNQPDDDGAQATRAHKHEEHGTARSPAETEVVKIVKGLSTKEERDNFKADFREEFGAGMSDLPESRHGDAMGWAKWYVNPDVGPAADSEPDPDAAANVADDDAKFASGEGY